MMKTFPSSNNNEFNKIINLLNNRENLFITGFAGTGKSYILRKLKEYYKEILSLTSTTGISAVNIGGQTIHSWAGVDCMDRNVQDLIKEFLNSNFGAVGQAKRRIKNCKILAIDEISMLSAYHFEYLDELFQAVRGNNLPFGGIQLVLIGDFLQLPPVANAIDISYYPRKTLFCFESSVWSNLNLKNIVLTKIYRQKDPKFTKTLCNLRLGKITEKDMELISKRFIDESSEINNKLHLFPKKIQTKRFNNEKLNELSTPVYTYKAYDNILVPESIENKEKYKKKVFYEMNNYFQAEYTLNLKVGCRVMLLINADFKSGLINGSCGYVTKLAKSYAVVKFDNGITKKISSCLFELIENDTVKATRFQLPLKLAYAITIHKSQGMTFDEIVIDCASSFSPGQVYVALSRVKSLKGLYITGFNPKKIYPNNKARNFYLKLDDENMDEIKDELYKKYC